MQYIFDNTFQGLLCCVFEAYEKKHAKVQLFDNQKQIAVLFEEHLKIVSDEVKAKRVWNGLKKKIPEQWLTKLYCCFLSNATQAAQKVFDCIRYFFDHKHPIFTNYGSPLIIEVNRIYRKVRYEQHRMKAFVRFQRTKDNIYYAEIAPDSNVLPLLSNHFMDRYADQKWIIYDTKRKYGLYYDLFRVEEIILSYSALLEKKTSMNLPGNIVAEDEGLYTSLWKDYYQAINIQERRNLRLHTQFLPKRYWRYLTEKQR